MESGRNGYWFISRASCFSLHKHLLHFCSTKAFFGIRYHRHQILTEMSLLGENTHTWRCPNYFTVVQGLGSSTCSRCSSHHLGLNGSGALTASSSPSLLFFLQQGFTEDLYHSGNQVDNKINRLTALRERLRKEYFFIV